MGVARDSVVACENAILYPRFYGCLHSCARVCVCVCVMCCAGVQYCQRMAITNEAPRLTTMR